MKFRKGNNGELGIILDLRDCRQIFEWSIFQKEEDMSDSQSCPLTHYLRINEKDIVIYLDN